MKIKSLFLFLMSLFPSFCFGGMGLELLPKGRPFRLTFPDPREIQMMLGFEGDSRINASIGNYFSIFAIRPTENADWQMHFGLEGAGFFTMRQAQHRFPLETADGLIGAYLEGANAGWQTQLRYTHISAHLADGSDAQAIAYSRETISLRESYLFSNETQVYGGIHYLANAVPKIPGWALQGGATAFLHFGTTKVVPFGGLDMKWKQESKFNPSLNIKLGIALNNPPEAYRSFRFFYSYYTGADPRGQYYDHVSTSHSLGVEMQI